MYVYACSQLFILGEISSSVVIVEHAGFLIAVRAIAKMHPALGAAKGNVSAAHRVVARRRQPMHLSTSSMYPTRAPPSCCSLSHTKTMACRVFTLCEKAIIALHNSSSPSIASFEMPPMIVCSSPFQALESVCRQHLPLPAHALQPTFLLQEGPPNGRCPGRCGPQIATVLAATTDERALQAAIDDCVAESRASSTTAANKNGKKIRWRRRGNALYFGARRSPPTLTIPRGRRRAKSLRFDPRRRRGTS